MKIKIVLVIILISIILIGTTLSFFYITSKKEREKPFVWTPDIWEDKVIWSDDDNHIWLYNISENKKKIVVSSDRQIIGPLISHNRIAWKEIDKPIHDNTDKTIINILDLDSMNRTEIISRNYVYNFNFYNNYIVTQESKFIVLYNINHGVVRSFDFNDSRYLPPVVVELNDEKFIWWDDLGTILKIHDILLNSTRSINLSNKGYWFQSECIDSQHFIEKPGIYGENISYIANKNTSNNDDVFVYNYKSNTKIRLSSDYTHKYCAEIYGENVVWESVSATYTRTIYRYSLKEQMAYIFFQTTAGLGSVKIYKNNIIWQEGNDNILIGNIVTNKIIRMY